jgi:hypothetical protein
MVKLRMSHLSIQVELLEQIKIMEVGLHYSLSLLKENNNFSFQAQFCVIIWVLLRVLPLSKV